MIMPGPDGDIVRSTGGQVDDMTMALIDSAYDDDQDVRDTIANALFNLGKKQPALVLSSCHSYLGKHAKLQQGHRVVVLRCMERVIKEKLDSVDNNLAMELIKQASQELTQDKMVVPEWQTAASGVLVALGTKYCNEVMEELLVKFQPGVLPHFFVIQTMGNLASANVYDMVPHLTAVLGTLLPMMGMAKHDNLRWVFSAALSKFSEAILEYVANIDQAPDPSVRIEMFSGEIFAAYDILFNLWLQSKEAKLRLAIVEALGHMAHVIARDKLEEQLPRLLPGILGLYKKHPDPYHITKGLCMALDAICIEGSVILEPFMDSLLGFLFPQICQPLDYNNSMLVKNHNELLRCFAVLARSFSGKLLGILLQKLESNNEKSRIGILMIFRHLINAAGPAMEDKKEVVVSGLKMALTDANNKVKKMFAQVVIAMAHHGYLELEGGQLMVEFIVRQCSLVKEPPGKRSPDPEYVSNEALKLMCENVLQLITTTIDQMEGVLWPYLLELIIPEPFTLAIPGLFHSLSYLANKKRKENADDYEIDFEIQANVPKPTTLIARIVVLSGYPTNGKERGLHALQLMQGLGPNIHEGVVELWDTVIPKLIQYLEDAAEKDEDKWSQKNWEDLLLKMLSKTLDVVDDEEWIANLGEAFGYQLPLYNYFTQEKNFAFKCLGIVMRKSTKKEFVSKHLDIIFQCVKHSDQLEREGCAIAMGFCAASHLDSVLTKLESVSKNEMTKKSSGLLGFMKQDKSESDMERIKATLMLCYGFVTLYSPPTLIISRMEATILRTINPHFVNIKDGSVKQNLIRTVELIGKALHPDHLQMQYNFTNRGDLISHMQVYMKAETTAGLGNETRALAIDACTTLLKLDPKLSEAEIFDLIKTTTDCIYPLPVDGMPPRGKGKEESYSDILETEVLMQATFDAMHDLLKEILNKEMTPLGLDTIFKHLYPWMFAVKDHERERVCKTWLIVLHYFLENFEIKVGAPAVFENAGSMLASIIPRCTDPLVQIRQLAVDCVQALLKITLRYQGNPPNFKDEMIDALPTLKDRLLKGDPNILFSVINDLSKVISKKLPPDQLQPFLDVLLEGLLDPQSHSSSGACVVLNGILKGRGGEVHKQVEKLLSAMHDKLCRITCPQTRTGTLRSIRTLASHHLISALTALISYPVPYDEHIVEVWNMISQDTQLTTSILDHFLDLLQKSLPYEEKRDRDSSKTTKNATRIPLADYDMFFRPYNFSASSLDHYGHQYHYAFHNLGPKVEETEELIMKYYHRLFAALMLRIGSTVGVKPLKGQIVEREEPRIKDKKKPTVVVTEKKEHTPIKASVEAFRMFLERTKSDDMIEALDAEECWSLFEDEEQYPEAFTILTRIAITHVPHQIPKIVAHLTSYLSSLYDTQRVVAAAFFAELINQKCAGDDTLVELVMNSLLGRLVDSSHVVRMLCIRGLGNVSSVSSEQVQKYSTTVLSAMMAGMDDKEDPEDDITTEAMSGLSKILLEIDESHIRAILINISLRIRPCFEKDRTNVRAQSITLFGNLSRFGDGPSKAPFLEQIHSNFISLVLHLNDPEMEVKKACKYTLRLLGPLMGSESIDEKFQKHLLQEANLFYGEFMNDIAKIVIRDFSDHVNFYVMGCIAFFKSIWKDIRSNAAMFAGFLLGNLPKDKQSIVSKEHICSALILLLKDQSITVRCKAAEAMSLLHEF